MYDEHRTLKMFIIAMIIILLCSGAGLMSYSYGKNAGYYEAYQSGQDNSYNKGLDKGKEEGYKVGYDAGYEAGYQLKPRETSASYTLRNPTYQEMKDFLANDTTSSKSYTEGKYICTDYSAEVNNNAEAQGIRCAAVYINYPETGHSIVAFETTDRGLIFIEPQFDKEVTLTVGKSYSKLNGYKQQEPVDDTIQRYQVIW